MKKRIQQFGGNKRVFLEENELNNMSDADIKRLNDHEDEALDIIKEGFATLTDKELRAITLKCEIDPESEDGRTYTDEKSAEIMGIKYKTFITTWLRAKKKLRKYARENAGTSIYIERMFRGDEK